MRHLHITVEPKELGLRARIPATVTLIATVIGLLFWGSPAAVLGGIGSVEVNPVNRVVNGWLSAHISEEVLETLTPAITNGDAASAICGEVLARWVIAALFHQRPRIPLRRIAHAMSPIHCAGSLSMQASASLNLSSKMILSNARFVSAVALTHPGSMPLTDSLGFIEDDQSPKTLAGEVFQGTHICKLYHKLHVVGAIA